ncbi:MAG: hypothetical protein ACHQXA_01900 [Gemmatimonadales bacterium]
MTPFLSLLLPIVVATVAVFILSTIIHMAMPWHKNDHAAVPDHDAAIAAIQSLKLAPDDYAVPNPLLPGGAKNPNFIADFERGPTFHLTVFPSGGMHMGKFMGAWFAFMLLISAIAGWVTGSIVPPGGNLHVVFHLSAIITACSYGFGAWPLSIWYHRRWSTAFKGTFDAILYGLAAGAVFMWLWPKM